MTDLLELIAFLCAEARRHTEQRNFGWARDCIENARRAAETAHELSKAVAQPPERTT